MLALRRQEKRHLQHPSAGQGGLLSPCFLDLKYDLKVFSDRRRLRDCYRTGIVFILKQGFPQQKVLLVKDGFLFLALCKKELIALRDPVVLVLVLVLLMVHAVDAVYRLFVIARL